MEGQPGPSEDAYLSLSRSFYYEIAIKFHNGISPQRVMEGARLIYILTMSNPFSYKNGS